MRVLITGAGLIGSHTAAELLSKQHSVLLYDMAPNEAYVKGVVGQPVDLRRGDAADFPTLVGVMLAGPFDCVVHTAGLIGGLAQRHPWKAVQANVLSSAYVAEAARLSGVRRVVYTSTQGVYDTAKCQHEPISESSPTASATVYGACKLSAENLLHAYSRAYELDVIVLRLSNVYGRGLYAAGSVGGEHFNAVLEPVARGKVGRILPAIKGRAEWLYVKDAARALALAAERTDGSDYLVANVGTGVLSTHEDILAAIREAVPGAEFVEPPSAGPIHRAAERFQPYDISYAQHTLGYAPQWDLRRGVADYIAEVQKVLDQGQPAHAGA